jgi:hypothetical protein
MTSPPTTAPAGATLLAPNAITRAVPTTPWASPDPSSPPVPRARRSLMPGLITGLHTCFPGVLPNAQNELSAGRVHPARASPSRNDDPFCPPSRRPVARDAARRNDAGWGSNLGRREESRPPRIQRPHLGETGHWSGGGATRCKWITSSPKPVIRCTSPERAPLSGNSARRVVVPLPTVTSQSSNSELSAVPA